ERLDDQSLATLAEYRGRLEQSWASVEAYAGRSFANPAVVPAIEAARSEFFGTFGSLRESVYEASAGGRPYPVSGDEWMAAATRAIDSLLVLSDAMGEATGNYAAQVEASGFNGFVASSVILAIAVLLGAVAFWLILTRIIRPIHALTGVMSRL